MWSKTSSSSVGSISAVGREGLGTAVGLLLQLPFAEELVFSAPRTGNGLTFADTLPQTAVGPGIKRNVCIISSLHNSPLLLCIMHKIYVM